MKCYGLIIVILISVILFTPISSYGSELPEHTRYNVTGAELYELSLNEFKVIIQEVEEREATENFNYSEKNCSLMWNMLGVDTFQIMKKYEKQDDYPTARCCLRCFLPPFPLALKAGLRFTVAYFARKNSDPEVTLLFLDQIMKAAEILESDNPDIRYPTHGPSCCLAIEMLQRGMKWAKQLNHEDERIHRRLAEFQLKATELVEGMVFDGYCGLFAAYQTALAYFAISTMYEDPRKQYFYRLLAQATFAKTNPHLPENCTRHTNDWEERVNWCNNNQAFKKKAYEKQESALIETISLVSSLLEQSKKITELKKKLELLAQAYSLAQLAEHMASSNDGKADLDTKGVEKLRQEITQTLKGMDFKASMTTIKQVFEETTNPYKHPLLNWTFGLNTLLDE